MALIELLYGTEAQTITLTLAGLANNAYRASTAIQNISTGGPLFTDVLVQVLLKTGGGATGTVKFYAYGTSNFAGPSGPLYPDNITGTDATIVPPTTVNSDLVYTLNTPAATTSYTTQPFSIARATSFNSILPEYWGIMVLNSSGAAFDATAANFVVVYQGIYNQSV